MHDEPGPAPSVERSRAGVARDRELLADIVESSDDAIIGLDLQHRILSWNPGAASLFGVEAQAVRGRDVTEVIVPEDRRELFGELLEAVRGGERLPPVEMDQRTRDGERRTVLITLSPLFARGSRRVAGVAYSARDISHLKRIEGRLRGLTTQLRDGLRERTEYLELLQRIAAIANESRSVESALRRSIELFCTRLDWPAGHAILTEAGRPDRFVDAGVWWLASGSPFEGLARRGARARHARGEGPIGKVIETARPLWVADVTGESEFLRHRPGAPIRSMLGFPMLAGQRVVGVLEFLSDRPRTVDPGLLRNLDQFGTQLGRVIERAEFERQLANLALQEQRRLGQELHDTLGQQVAALGMMARSLQKKIETGNPDAPASAERLVRTADEAKRHVRALSRGLVPVEIDASGLMSALEDLCQQTALRFGAHCEFVCREPVLLEESFTATQLYLVAQEAVHNAVKHSESGRVVITLEQRDRRLRLSVEDDGKGIPHDPADLSGRGVHIMHYRSGLIGAELRIDSPEAGGTVVSCSLELGHEVRGETETVD